MENLLPFESTAGQEFRNIIIGNNFLTPRIMGYILINNEIIEISTGVKFLDLDVFGVTVVKQGCREDSLSKCFNSLEEVQAYITKLNYEDLSSLVNLINDLMI